MSKAAPQTTPATQPAAPSAVTFRDRAWKYRSVILDDGREIKVDNYLATVSEPDLIDYLAAHPDFERVTEG